MQVDNLVRFDEGFISARVFGNPDLYPLELERVFGKSWLFVAHVSEIPNPGDFVVRSMGEDSVLVTNGRDGAVRVLLNLCRHRGRRVCADDEGTATTFRCGYHGWTYNERGDLTGVPFGEAYGEAFDKSQSGLIQARVEQYHGLIFATWNQQIEPLREHLGSMAWVLDLMFGRSEAVEVIGAPIRWIADADWKLGTGNFIGDAHHVMVTHGFSAALGAKASRSGRVAHMTPTENGHGAFLIASQTDEPYLALPRELWPELQQHLSPEQYELMRDLKVIAGSVFPNLSFLETSSHTHKEWGGPEGSSISFLTLRQWQPRGPGKMEALSWFLVDRNVSQEWKEMSRTCYQRVFGVGGSFEQDDLENWAAITDAVHGRAGRDVWLDYRLGLDQKPSPNWPGPGKAYYLDPPVLELPERLFYRRWQQLLANGSSA